MTDQPNPGSLANRLRLAHQARRAKERQLDDVRRALCDVGVIEDDDPYSHADLADVIRQTLTGSEARDLADQLGADLYRAEDALAFVGECCDIADREGQPITTAQVREWLKGARCGRQLLSDRAADPAAHRPGDTDPHTLAALRAMTDEANRTEPRHPLETDRA